MVRLVRTARIDEYWVVVPGYGPGIMGDEDDGHARRTIWRWGWAAENRGRSGQVSSSPEQRRGPLVILS
jgi:hypothetical protein